MCLLFLLVFGTSALLHIPGVHQHHKDLPLSLFVFNNVCCNTKYIFILQKLPALVSVYNWSGSHLGDILHTQLGLHNKKDFVYGIGSLNEDAIMLAVGPFGNVSSLHIYSIV